VQQHTRKQQQQQQPGGEASGEDTGPDGAGSSSSTAWLPKEAFIRQLVASCCEGERQEKVVIFSQVGAEGSGGRAWHASGVEHRSASVPW
jgi:hypothetical protein